MNSGGTSEGFATLRLVPGALDNPDLDLRYVVPDRIAELTHGRVTDNGYDYLDDADNSMALFMVAERPAVEVPVVLEILRTELFLENTGGCQGRSGGCGVSVPPSVVTRSRSRGVRRTRRQTAT